MMIPCADGVCIEKASENNKDTLGYIRTTCAQSFLFSFFFLKWECEKSAVSVIKKWRIFGFILSEAEWYQNKITYVKVQLKPKSLVPFLAN